VQYQPNPIDTSKVELTQPIRDLMEELARNAHDIWGQQRMRDGWRYGPRRDDAKKEHPNLVPYEQLEEGDKEYDRSMVAATLKAMVALGYRIEKG
jgi:hypothetical protein